MKIDVPEPKLSGLYSSRTDDTGNIFVGLKNVAKAIIYLADILKVYFEERLTNPKVGG